MSKDVPPSAEDKARYDKVKEELVKMLKSKRNADKALAQIELQIYNLEGTYLTDTAAHSGGNIIQGFEGYLKNQSVGRRKYEASDADRIFSNSSLTYQKSLDLLGEGDESTATVDDYKQPTPGLTTVIVPPAPRNAELSAAQQKKNRDREYQRRKRANARRSSGTISDDETQSVGRRPTKRARMMTDDD
ncbi:NuA4-domain-containing protein [Leucogyrophana mollusca]|uniref:NuA4-domain-containing protein n=1 Tax=Leucogyrophana mollusca TaxID=85980 RepID=A0ACB8B789_9AGAM|nr:NuA4-domain-containing protein [Leucogyrophana mollusca]